MKSPNDQSPLQVEEGNRLIDAFAPEITKKMQWGRPKHIIEHEGLLYHSSWDWLMPVVEKIFSLGFFWYIIENGKFQIGDEPAITTEADKTIDAVWKGVIQFIQWGNKIKTHE